MKRPIASGGQGVVYLARSPNGHNVALKALSVPKEKSEQRFIERFKQEFSILSKTRHPNIVEIYDFGYDEKNNIYYFTTEYLKAQSLKVCSIKLSVKDLELLFIQALRSLSYLKSRDIYHLDIKPSNFLISMVDGRFCLKLIDFGLATLLPTDNPGGGTLFYMSPEVAYARLKKMNAILPEFEPRQPLPNIEHKSDLYSLAVTFYEILTRTNPFKVIKDGRPDIILTMLSHLKINRDLEEGTRLKIVSPSLLNPKIPEYLDEIIMRNLEFRPEDRFESAAWVAQSLNIRSPYTKGPETVDTYLSYIPDSVGREKELDKLQNACRMVSKGNLSHPAKPVFIVATSGIGKTTLLNAIKPFAQTIEMDVVQSFPKSSPSKPTVVMIDDIDVVLKHRRRSDISNLLHSGDKRILFVFTLNPKRVPLKNVLDVLHLSADDIDLTKLKPFTAIETKEYLENIYDITPQHDYVKHIKLLSRGSPKFLRETLIRAIKLNGKIPHFDSLSHIPCSSGETKNNDKLKKAEAILKITEELINLELYREAIRKLKKIRRCPDQIELQRLEFLILIYNRTRDTNRALPYLKRALEIVRKHRSHKDFIEAGFRLKGHLAYSLMLEGKYSEGVKVLEDVISVAKSTFVKDRFKKFRYSVPLGQVLYYACKYSRGRMVTPQRVIAELNKELKIFRKEKNTREIVQRYYFLGEIHREFRLPKALEFYNRGIDLAKPGKFHRYLARLYNAKGTYYNLNCKDYRKAQWWFKKALELLMLTGDLASTVESSYSLSIALFNSGSYLAAISHLEDARFFILNGGKGLETGAIRQHLPDVLLLLSNSYLKTLCLSKAKNIALLAEAEARSGKFKTPAMMYFNIYGTLAEICKMNDADEEKQGYLNLAGDYAEKEPKKLMKPFWELKNRLLKH